MNPQRSLWQQRWFWPVALLCTIAAFYALRSQTRSGLQVRVAEVARLPLASTISTNGRVEPVVNYQLNSPLAGNVKAVYVQAGQQVVAGQLLLALDDVEARAHLATAESGVRAAEAALDAATHNGTQQERQQTEAELVRERIECSQAHRTVDTLIRLKANGAASAAELAEAQARLSSAEAALHASEANAHSRYSAADMARERAALADAHANLVAARAVVDRAQVRAPVAGTVYSLDVARGDFVEEGKRLAQIANLHEEQVHAYFDEPEIGQLKVGQKIQIKWDARQGRIWNGHIERVPVAVITYGTRNVGEALVRIDDIDGGLLPDTNVTVTVAISSDPNALSAPREALRTTNGRTYVYKLVGNRLERTFVTTGAINLTQASILSGLNAGDRVATGTQNGQPLVENLPVKVVQ